MTDRLMTTPDDSPDIQGRIGRATVEQLLTERPETTVETIEQKRERFLQILATLRENLELHPNVWGPTSAWETLRVLIKTGQLDNIEGKCVIDVGCGTGIFGVAFALFGASEITFVDNNESATAITAINAEKFGIADRCRIIHSDVFDSVPHKKYDVLISNPPFNPFVEGVVITNPAERSNQNEDAEGIRVLSDIIENLYKYLVPETGIAFVDFSSRQGIGICKNILDANIGVGNWEIINTPESPEDAPLFDGKYSELVDYEYIRPFITHLTVLSERDGLPRIMYPDSEGNLLLHIRNNYRNPSHITYIVPNYELEENNVLRNGANIYKVTTENVASTGQTIITNTSIDSGTLVESPVSDPRKNRRIAAIANNNPIDRTKPHHQFLRVKAKISGEV